MRWLLAAALSLALALPAFAQSDNRKVALFYMNGDAAGGNGQGRTTGNLVTVNDVSGTHHMVTTALERMGVPIVHINLRDSTGGWASSFGATRPAGVADSTWFRQNGILGWILVLNDISSSASGTVEPVRYFTDAGSNRGTFTGSPMDGNWGIPGLVFNNYASTNAGVPFFNGSTGEVFDAGAEVLRKAFVNGDSLAWARDATSREAPGEAANVTKIIVAGDTLSAASSRMSAWRYKNSTYWYGMPTYPRPTTLLLGIAQLFSHAGYKPRRKLNLHWTLDHIVPEEVLRTAPSDSFFAYVRANPWRMSGASKADPVARQFQAQTLLDLWRPMSVYWPAFPHSHDNQWGNLFSGAAWNFSTYADTSTIRQRWNSMERAITDTLRLTPARGYEKTIGFPGDGVHFPHLYIFAENGYASIRAPASDSVGHRHNLSAGQRVFSRALTGANSNYGLPWTWVDPVSGRPLMVHDLYSHPGADDTTWAMIPSDINDGVEGKSANYLNLVSKAIIFDSDFYWHPNENLEGENVTGTNNDPMRVLIRRFSYFFNRIANICTVQPNYQPKTPRPAGQVARN